MLSSGWLASYVGQSEVPALITSLFWLCMHVVYSSSNFLLFFSVHTAREVFVFQVNFVLSCQGNIRGKKTQKNVNEYKKK